MLLLCSFLPPYCINNSLALVLCLFGRNGKRREGKEGRGEVKEGKKGKRESRAGEGLGDK